MTRLKRIADWIGAGVVYAVAGFVVISTLLFLLLFLLQPQVLIAIGVIGALLVVATLLMAGNAD